LGLRLTATSLWRASWRVAWSRLRTWLSTGPDWALLDTGVGTLPRLEFLMLWYRKGECLWPVRRICQLERKTGRDRAKWWVAGSCANRPGNLTNALGLN